MIRQSVDMTAQFSIHRSASYERRRWIAHYVKKRDYGEKCEAYVSRSIDNESLWRKELDYGYSLITRDA